MPAVPPREARRLASRRASPGFRKRSRPATDIAKAATRSNQPRAKRRAAGLVLGALLATACAAGDVHARAARLDTAARTGAYTWIVEHEPSALDVAGFPVDAVRPLDPGARIRAVEYEPRAACREARDDRALLLFDAPVARTALRSAALDCGFALERDRTAVIVAPR